MRHAARIQGALALDEFTGFASSLARLGSKLGAVADVLRFSGMFFKPRAEQFIQRAAYKRGDLWVEKFLFRLIVERWVLQLDADDRGQSFAQILAGDCILAIFKDAGALAVTIDSHSDRLLECRDVRSAIAVWNVVSKRQERFIHGVRVLHGNVCARSAFLILAGNRNNGALRVLRSIHVPNVASQSIGGVEMLFANVARRVNPLVAQGDLDARIQEAQFTEAMLKALKLEIGVSKDFVIRLEGNTRSIARPRLAFSDHMQRLRDFPACKCNLVGLGALVDLYFSPFAEGVDALDTHAVQTARDLVSVAVKLAAGMHLGQDDLNRGSTIDGWILMAHGVDWHSAPVILDHATAVNTDGHVDIGGVPGHDLIDRVVDAFVNEVVQPFRSCATDVHTRAFPDGFQALQDLDGARGVFVGGGGGVGALGRSAVGWDGL